MEQEVGLAHAGSDGLGQVKKAPVEHTLRLKTIAIEGFKTYSDPATIEPLGNLTCICGPNGTGKSVIGEAIAFALGASARMLRVKTLAGVISACERKDGSLPDAATVTLHFEAFNPATGEAITTIGMRRTVSRTGRCRIQLALSTAETVAKDHNNQVAISASDMDLEASNSDEEVILEDIGSWCTVSLAEADDCLASYGLHIHPLERLVVTQHRQAVEVADPIKLTRFIEVLIGTAGLRGDVEEHDKQLQTLEAAQDDLNDQMEVMQEQCQAVYPVVQRYKEFQRLKVDVLRKKAQVLGLKAKEADAEAASAAEALAAVELNIEMAAEAQELARLGADALLETKDEAARAVERAREHEASLEEQRDKWEVEVEKAKVQVRAAQEKVAACRSLFGGGDAGPATAEDLGLKLSSIERQLGRSQGRAQAFKEQKSEAEQQLKAMAATIHGKDGNAGTVPMETARLGLERARGRLRSAESSLETLLAQQANQDMHCQALQAAADELVVEVDQHTAALAELEGKAAACRASRVTAEEDQRKGQEQRDTANAELEAVRDKLAEVQDTITELVSQLAEQCEALRGHAGGDCGRGGDGWQSVDEAVAVLAQQSAGPGQGQLPGKFYGRLHSMLRLSNPDAATPVNACLRECWNLATTVITSDRATGEAVVRHFREHRVGVATCITLDSIPEPAAISTPAPQHSTKALVPLGDLIQVDNAAQGIPGAASLIPFLLTGWYLAPTAAIAAEALEQDRSLPYAQRRNLVTPAGDLFKADGEVVGRVKVGPLGDPLQPYFVMETCTDVGSTTQGAAHEVAEASALLQEQIMAERDAAMVIAEQLSAQRARLAERLCEAQAALDGCESKRRMLSQELRSLERKVSQQKVTLQAATAALQKDSARLAVAQADTAALVQRVAQATEAVVMRKGELVAAEEAYMAQAGATEGGAALLEHEKMMEEAETALQREAVRQEDLKVQYAQLHQQLTTVQANEEAIRKAQAWQEGAEEKLKEAETAGKTAKNVLKKARRSRMKAEAASNNADADWRDAIQRHQEAAKAHQRQLMQQQLLLQDMADAEQRAEKFRAEAHEVAVQADKLGGMIGHDEFHLGSGKRPAIVDSASVSPHTSAERVSKEDGAGMGSGSESDFEDGERGRSCRARGAKYPISSHTFSRRRKVQHGAASPPGMGMADLAAEDADRAEAELKRLERELARVERTLDTAAVHQGTTLIKMMEAAGEELRRKEDEATVLALQRDDLQAKRYSRFVDAMEVAGNSLSDIYQRLTGGMGDAHCAFPRDETAAFDQGVTFKVRPDNSVWRPFAALSGGQQALAALALCLALQAAAPAPFYFFDEIDAALDSVNAECLAQYLAEVSQTANGAGAAAPMPPQFIVVSHKPSMPEVADFVVGVVCSAHGQGSQVVPFVAGWEEEEED